MRKNCKKGDNTEMKQPTNKDKEEMILKGISLDELISMKIEEDYKKMLKDIKKPVRISKITDLKKLTPEAIFSKKSVFKTFNKTTRTESYINGLQAEGLLGLQKDTREALVSGKIKSFISGDTYVEFLWAEVSD